MIQLGSLGAVKPQHKQTNINHKHDNNRLIFKTMFSFYHLVYAVCNIKKSVGEMFSKSVGKLSSNPSVDCLKTFVGKLSCR